MALTKIQAAMVDDDVATQAELDAAIAEEVSARNAAITSGNVKLSGDVVQVVSTQTGAVATMTALIPGDDTIPQITEGTEVMTRAITPTNASNILEIEVVVNVGNGGTSTEWMTAALFQDSTANALACGFTYAAANTPVQVVFKHRMVAGTTSATTFRVRFGGNTANTFTFNGLGGGRYFGGVLASSITVREIKA